MAEGETIFQLTARLRRQFSRQEGVLRLCDEVERLSTIRTKVRPKRDRAAYMRGYRQRNGHGKGQDRKVGAGQEA